jgi:hypothetical protein
MRTLYIYPNSRFVSTGMGIQSNEPGDHEEVNLDLASEEEFAQLMNDPYNDSLIDKIKART